MHRMRILIPALLLFLAPLFAYSAETEKSAFEAFMARHENARALFHSNRHSVKFLYDFEAPAAKGLSKEEAARKFLLNNGDLFGASDSARELVLNDELAMRGGEILRFKQEYKGVPLLYGGVNVVFNRAGEIARVHDSRRDVTDLDTLPAIGPREALSSALLGVYGPQAAYTEERSLDEMKTMLVIWNFDRILRLAYMVYLPSPALHLRRMAFVDAKSGELIAVKRLIMGERMVNAWEFNPGADSENATVERMIASINQGQPYLEGGLFSAYNCPDRGEKANMGGLLIPICTVEHLAEEDSNGDFLFDPVFGEWNENGADEDEFPEAHLYYHIERFYTFFQELALYINPATPPFVALNCPNLTLVANYKGTDLDFSGQGPSTDKLPPYDNAFFAPGGLGGLVADDDAICMGQGESTDFAYDADVIYHEFTHAVIDSAVGLGGMLLDSYGLNQDPTNMNEGYADYFSATYTGDPLLGEYVGSAFGEDGYLRDATNSKKCPDWVRGEVHADSEWWSAALWTLRETYKASEDDSRDIDAAIFSALLELPESPDYTEAATTTAVSIGEWLGAEARDFAEREFEDRGLIECNRAIPVTEELVLPYLLLYDMLPLGLKPYAPGFAQFHFSIPERKTYLKIAFKSPLMKNPLTENKIDLDVVFFVRKGEAVTFALDQDGKTMEAAYDYEVHLKELSISSDSSHASYSVEIPPDTGLTFEAGDWYVATGNKTETGVLGAMGMGSIIMIDVNFEIFEPECLDDDDCDFCNYCDENGTCLAMEAPCSEPPPPKSDGSGGSGGGGACSGGGEPGPLLLLLLAAALALASLRRRPC